MTVEHGWCMHVIYAYACNICVCSVCVCNVCSEIWHITSISNSITAHGHSGWYRRLLSSWLPVLCSRSLVLVSGIYWKCTSCIHFMHHNARCASLTPTHSFTLLDITIGSLLSQCADITCIGTGLSISHYYITHPGRVMTKSTMSLSPGEWWHWRRHVILLCFVLLWVLPSVLASTSFIA